MFGIGPVMWYNESEYLPVILIVGEVWKGLGYGAVIYYAALMGVDSEYYEAAKIDGIWAILAGLEQLAPSNIL